VKGTCTVDYIDHVGVVVRNVEGAMSFFSDVFGIQPQEIKDLTEHGVRVTLLALGQTRLELLQPLGPDTPVARFLERRGEGLHHLAFNVKSVSESLESLKDRGLEAIDPVPRKGLSGLIAFIHPRSVHGVLTELVETV